MIPMAPKVISGILDDIKGIEPIPAKSNMGIKMQIKPIKAKVIVSRFS